jgi:hypothetical protein
MPAAAQIAFRYRAVDSAQGITRETTKRLAMHLDVDETQAIHLALSAYARSVLPQYERDDGPVPAAQIRKMKKMAPKPVATSVASSLFD